MKLLPQYYQSSLEKIVLFACEILYINLFLEFEIKCLSDSNINDAMLINAELQSAITNLQSPLFLSSKTIT